MVYGLQTFKSNGSTVVLQNSTKSGVFARTYTLTPANATLVNGVYRKEFPEYAGRTIRVFQLKTGNAVWSAGTTGSGLNVIEFNIVNPSSTLTDPRFVVGNTIVYIFVK
jgi:hypothetical protein